MEELIDDAFVNDKSSGNNQWVLVFDYFQLFQAVFIFHYRSF